MLMPSQETEWEELIRTGQMTPFGTRIPQKSEKKEPRKVTMAEDSAFDMYLADQAKMAVSRKKPAPVKKTKKKSSEGNVSAAAAAAGAANGAVTSSKDKKQQKRMRKLQATALRAQPVARPKAEPQAPKPRKRYRADGGGTDSEGSEYLPSDEGVDPERERREAAEEGFGDDDDDDDGYALKAFKKRPKGREKKGKKKEGSDEEYSPGSSEDDKDDAGKKGKEKRCQDDGDVEFYRQRIRWDKIFTSYSCLALVVQLYGRAAVHFVDLLRLLTESCTLREDTLSTSQCSDNQTIYPDSLACFI